MEHLTLECLQNDGDLSYQGMISPNGSAEDSESAQLRRSTRASALKAQEKLKISDLQTGRNSADQEDGSKRSASAIEDGNIQNEEEDGESKSKKAKLAENLQMTQSDPRFGIKLNERGDVVLLSDESEVSSLNEDEIDFVRKNYEQIVSCELSKEQKREREIMLMQLEAELRLEEAKLIILKKIQMSQKVQSKHDLFSKAKAAGQMNSGNNLGNAYKPVVAQPPNRFQNHNNKAAPSAHQKPLQAHQNRPQVPPAHLSNGRSGNMQSGIQNRMDGIQTSTQRQATAKLTLRRQLEQQLLQIPPPRPPPSELHFIPNPNQPDFCHLLGLDLAVHRVLKYKNATRKSTTKPYVCSECDTDFTPLWKALSDENSGGLILKCEQCVRSEQKKRLKSEHTALLRSAFSKALQQEQELEKQIKEGKYDSPILAAAATENRNSTHSKHQSMSQSHRQVNQHSSRQQSNMQHHHKQQNRASASSANVSNANQVQAAAAAQAAMLQRQLSQNPLMTAMMSNPALMANMFGAQQNLPMNPHLANMLSMGWNPALAQRFPNLAMAALAQAAAAGGPPPMTNAQTQKEILKQMQQQQQNFLQRQMFDSMLPKQTGSGKFK